MAVILWPLLLVQQSFLLVAGTSFDEATAHLRKTVGRGLVSKNDVQDVPVVGAVTDGDGAQPEDVPEDNQPEPEAYCPTFSQEQVNSRGPMMVKVGILSAANLPKLPTDSEKGPDTFVRYTMTIGSVKEVATTRIVKQNKDPTWDFYCSFPVPKIPVPTWRSDEAEGVTITGEILASQGTGVKDPKKLGSFSGGMNWNKNAAFRFKVSNCDLCTGPNSAASVSSKFEWYTIDDPNGPPLYPGEEILPPKAQDHGRWPWIIGMATFALVFVCGATAVALMKTQSPTPVRDLQAPMSYHGGDGQTEMCQAGPSGVSEQAYRY